MNKIIKTFKLVVFENYANFSGRARRSEYWYFVLACFIISIVLELVESIITSGNGVTMYTSDRSAFADLFSLLIFLPSLAVGVRRLHDSDKSGWWILLPIYNLYLLIRKGTVGSNRFGSDWLSPAVVAQSEAVTPEASEVVPSVTP